MAVERALPCDASLGRILEDSRNSGLMDELLHLSVAVLNSIRMRVAQSLKRIGSTPRLFILKVFTFS
jgi:hypothetical protein